VIDQKKILGFSTAIVGAIALGCAEWTLVPTATTLVLLFLLAGLVGHLSGRMRHVLTTLLVIITVLARSSVRSVPITDFRHGVLSFLAGTIVCGFLGVQLGSFLRRKLDQYLSLEN
jgi:hypothetical protein